MSDKFRTEWFTSSTVSREVTTGIIKKKVEKRYSQREIDMDKFAAGLERAYNNLDSAGYDVVNVVPVATGTSESLENNGGAYLGEVGFSITRGAVVIGQKRD